MTPLDLPHLQTWIGREETEHEILTPSLVARLLTTLDREGATQPGAAAPQLTHLCLCLPIRPTKELGPDGHPARGGFLPPVPLPRRMWAGGAFQFDAPLLIGEEVTRQSRILDVSHKIGRSGQLCFVTVEHRLTSGGRLCVTERHDIVYRDLEGPTAKPVTAPPAPQGVHQRRITPSAALLFRYSALTFNGHRIHYDAPYVQNDEGYPGLIVHGPLQATMLAHFAADLAGKPLKSFRFRSLSTLFDTEDFLLHAQAQDDGWHLWTATEGGPLAMEAWAEV